VKLRLVKNISPIKLAKNRYRKLAILFLLLLLVISIVLYALEPIQSAVSMPLFYTVFILMIITNIIYFKAKKKFNYLDFDTIFIFIYCLVGFTTTFLYHDELLFRVVFFGFPVDEEYINKGNLLFLIGLQSYSLGSLSKPNKIKKTDVKPVVINTKILQIFVIILTLIFILSGGISYFRAVYGGMKRGGAGISLHVLVFLITTAIALIATELYNKKLLPKYKINKIAIGIMCVLVCLLLWCGSRTSATQLVLPFVCLFAMLFRNIKFKLFLGFIILGIIGMWIAQNIRSNTQINFGQINSPIVLISDLTMPARTTYNALEYTNQHGYTYGKSMSLGVFGIIPFLPSIVTRGDDEQFGSPLLLTKYTYKTHKISTEYTPMIGLGITIIADIYLSFGLIGVILLMYFLGYLINRYVLRTLSINYYATIIMAGLLANSVFLVRSDYTYGIRYVLWTLFIAYINKSIVTNLINEKKNSDIYTES
jgi:oligosaccharide repeat unit polymerase